MKVILLKKNAKAPARATDFAAGYDLYSAEECSLQPMERRLIDTGIAIELPNCWAGMIWPRSGLAIKHGVDTMAGLIDSDYRGEVKVLLVNFSDFVFNINVGDRIAQLVVQPVYQQPVDVVETLNESVRGVGGFGSTGVK